ncbi:MAG: hypothetical protein JW849_01735 [Phycisphaerae bacterium]|nr:hypothetical protein [Phycisphaerae bacterium]
MMDKSEEQPAKSIEEVIAEDGRYRVEAFGFLHEGLSRAVKDVYEDTEGPGHHVTGQQLCGALRNLAMERYGLMAPAVLRSWGVRESIDFGNMVYLLIEHGMMRKTEEDTVEDFRDVFHLETDFDTSGSIRMKKE